MMVKEVDFIDDGEQRNFEQDGVQPGAFYYQLEGGHGNAYKAPVQSEQTQEIDEIGFEIIELPEVIQVSRLKTQAAQSIEFPFDRFYAGRKVDSRGAAQETILHLRRRLLVQDYLHHAEFIEISIKQRLDDGLVHKARLQQVAGGAGLRVQLRNYIGTFGDREFVGAQGCESILRVHIKAGDFSPNLHKDPRFKAWPWVTTSCYQV